MGEKGMTPTQFSSIKSSIESAKKRSDMAEGAKNKILENLSREFGIDDIDEVQIELEKMSKGIKKDKKSKEILETELEGLYNWEEE
jgi:hypothetical protein